MSNMAYNAEHYEQLIEDALRLRCAGSLRVGVLERMALNDEYTEGQFSYWMDCMEQAADFAATSAVSSGILRDMAKIYFARGNDMAGVNKCRQALEICPQTPFRSYLENLVAEHTK